MPTTALFDSDANGAIDEYNATTGAPVQSFASELATQGITPNILGADSTGAIYAFGNFGSNVAVETFAIGATNAGATYTASNTDLDYMEVAPTGAVAVSSYAQNAMNAITGTTIDIWDAGHTGAPSRSQGYGTAPAGFSGIFALGQDGTLYWPYPSSGPSNPGGVSIAVYPPGSNSQSGNLVDRIATGQIYPNVVAVGPDGTLYIGSWGYSLPDSAAGLYVFPPSGVERFVSSMAPGIVGIDFDGAGRVYVASDNATYANPTDTAQQVSIYSPQATSLISQTTTGAPGVLSMTVGNDGSAYLVQDNNFGLHSNAPANGAIAVLRPGAAAATTLIATQSSNVVLEQGMSEDQGTDRRRVFGMSFRGGSSHAGASAASRGILARSRKR